MPRSSRDISGKDKTIYDIIKIWFVNSPTHGIRRISRANSISGRLFWSTTLLIFTTLMCTFIYTVIMKYIANPTKISLSVRPYHKSDHIPAVTFCNLNPLRNKNFLDECKNLLHSSCTDDECYNHFIEYMTKILDENIKQNQLIDIPYGYKLDELLIQCTFNNRLCNRNFSKFFHPSYGNCYTFNNIINTKNLSHDSTINNEYFNDAHILFLELFLYQNEYISCLDERAAFRIYIHDKNEIPILSSNSLFLSPRIFTKLIYTQRIIHFSQQCRKDLTNDMKNIFDFNLVRYSQSLCFKLCEFRYIEKKCQCIDRLFMIFIPFFSKNHTTKIYANRSCPINYNCHTDRSDFDPKQLCPECLPECELIQYTIQSSYAAYPNRLSSDKVMQRVEKYFKIIDNGTTAINISACVNNRKDDLLDDIVAVEISASPYATEILEESPMYTWVDLISSIGGQAGLWIGVSLISFVEIGELLFLIFCHCVKIIYKKIRNY